MILRVHYNFDLKGGGAEYHILKLIDVFDQYGGTEWKNYLILIEEHEGKIKLKLHDEENTTYLNKISDLPLFFNNLIARLNIKIVHIHTLPYPNITKKILKLNLPTFRSMHEPMLVCPGWAKYWLSDDMPCNVKFGLVCIKNAYIKKCTKSRNPIQLLNAYNNVKYELNEATHKYIGIFHCSDYVKNEAIKVNINENKLIKVPSPQHDYFDDNKKIDNETIKIIYSGRLSKQKGVKYLIEVVSKLKLKGYCNFEVLIFGKGPDENYLKQLSSELGLNNLIRFFGWVDRDFLVENYKKAHISVIPSTYPDTFPNSVAESMLASLAIVAFDAGGTCEWFDHLKSGIKVPNMNREQLFEEIQKLLNDRDLILNLGLNARKKILLNHSFKRTFEVYSENYERVL